MSRRTWSTSPQKRQMSYVETSASATPDPSGVLLPVGLPVAGGGPGCLNDPTLAPFANAVYQGMPE